MGHAVRSCRELVDGPFVVINADDYYGKSAFSQIYDYLTTHKDGEKMDYAMVGYVLENTLTENGHVARGVCTTDDLSHLTGITERTRIERRGDETAYTEDEGKTWHTIPAGSIVSMNLWGFTESFMKELNAGKGVCPFPGEKYKRKSVKMRIFPSQCGKWAVGRRQGAGDSAEIL